MSSSKLSCVKKYCFDATLDSKESIENYISTQCDGMAHPLTQWDETTKTMKRYLIVNTSKEANGNNTKMINVTDINPSYWINSADLGSVEETITGYLTKFSNLRHLREYSLVMINQGEIIKVPVATNNENVDMFVATNKTDGNYFDFVVYSQEDQFKNINYSNQRSKYFRHSGDVGSLLQYVDHSTTIPPNNLNSGSNCGVNFVLAVVGFRMRMIRYFKEQLPVVVIVDHTNKKLNLIPCPLDQATMGDATCSGLVVGHHNSKTKCMEYSILEKPMTLPNVDTGHTSNNIKSAFSEVVQTVVFNTTTKKTPEIETVSLNDMNSISNSFVNEKDKEKVNENNKEKVNDNQYNVFIESGLTDSKCMPALGNKLHYVKNILYFGSGFSETNLTDERKGPMNLPHLFGKCENIAGCALGNTPSKEIHISFSENKYYPIVHLSENWLDSSQIACTTSGNGLFIIHVSGKKDLNNVNINSLCMAGPNSIVLIEMSGKYYFFRGVHIPELFDEVPAYGTELPSDHQIIYHIRKLNDTSSNFSVGTQTKVNFPILYTQSDRTNKKLYFGDTGISVEKFLENMAVHSIEDIAKFSNNIIDMLTQISVILQTDEVKTIRDTLNKILLDKISNVITPMKQALREYVKTSRTTDPDFGKKSREMSREYRTLEKKLNNDIAKIVNQLANLTSVRGASSQKQNLKRLERITKIKDNIANANNMSLTDLCDLLDENCSEVGALITDVNSGYLSEALKAVSNGQFLSWIMTNKDKACQLLAVSPRTPYLDSITMGCILEQTTSQVNHPLYSSGNGCVSIPGIGTNGSSLPLILLDDHINCEDPSEFFWPEEANRPEVATFRIKLRGTITNANCSRKLHISPGSNDLGFFLVNNILSIIERLTSGMTPPANLDDKSSKFVNEHRKSRWNDSNCQILRGLYGQLFALLASGQNVLSMAFQLVGNKPNIEILPANQSWILTRMLKNYPYTMWSMNNIRKNMKYYVIRYIRKRITDTITEPMRKSLSLISAQSLEESSKNRNEELKWLQIAVDVIFKMVAHADDFKSSDFKSSVNDIGKRLFDYATPLVIERGELKGSGGIYYVWRFVKHMVDQGSAVFDRPDLEFVLQTCLNITTKRSAAFKQIKNELLQASTLSDESQWNSKLNEYQQIIDDYRKMVNHNLNKDDSQVQITVRVQNEQSIKKHDENGIRGDAELIRTPWRVRTRNTNDTDTHTDVSQIINSILGVGFEQKSNSNEQSSNNEKNLIQLTDQEKFVMKVKILPNSTKVVELANSLFTDSYVDILQKYTVAFNATEYNQLFYSLGFMKSTEIESITKYVIREYILGWQDPKGTESKLLKTKLHQQN